MSLQEDLRTEARRIGFDSVGFCRATHSQWWPEFLEWIGRGYHGTMEYIPRRKAAYRHPEGVLKGCRSLMLLTLNYHHARADRLEPGCGRVSVYATGNQDYHDTIRAKLKQLSAWLRERAPAARVRGIVDTAPLFEREFAQRAGLGWIGKHTLLLNRQQGSWFFLAALLTDLEWTPDSPFEHDHCGSCRACLDACPTQAFPEPYVLDARRCISYLTIEHRGPIDPSLRAELDSWVFGCDVCQDVCPWNRQTPSTREPAFARREDLDPLELIPLFQMDDKEFARRFQRTPLSRPGRSGLLRNAALVLGNQRCTEAIPTLKNALADADPIVRGAAAWALGQWTPPVAVQELRQALAIETNAAVRKELLQSLAGSVQG